MKMNRFVIEDSARKDPSEIVKMIDLLSAESCTFEKDVEDAFIAYSALDNIGRAEVSNVEKLLSLREEITKSYVVKQNRGKGMDQSKLLLGTYCVRSDIWTNEHIKALKDCGIDLITGGAYDKKLLDLCEKYGIGVFLSYLPGWWGGDGDNSGKLASERPLGCFKPYAEKFEDHSVIWGMDVGDEPSAEDFPHYGLLINEAKELFPDKQIYLNLYPNYACEKQMGCKTYYDHIQSYVKNVDTDYICYDHYLYCLDDGKGNPIPSFANLGIVSDAAIKSGRDMWIVLQISSVLPDTWITEQQLRYQTYSALAFGAKMIHWACWTAGWWHPDNQVVDSKGNFTKLYDILKNVNFEIKAFAPIYMRYTCKDTAFVSHQSDLEVSLDAMYLATCNNDLNQTVLSEIETVTDSTVLMGYFEKNIGKGSAFMITNVSDYLCDSDRDARVRFKLSDVNSEVNAYFGDSAVRLTADADGYYEVCVNNGEGIFVTVTPIE